MTRLYPQNPLYDHGIGVPRPAVAADNMFFMSETDSPITPDTRVADRARVIGDALYEFLDEIPCYEGPVGEEGGPVIGSSARRYERAVGRTAFQLGLALRAVDRGSLAEALERASRDLEESLGKLDAYVGSDKFRIDEWRHPSWRYDQRAERRTGPIEALTQIFDIAYWPGVDPDDLDEAIDAFSTFAVWCDDSDIEPGRCEWTIRGMLAQHMVRSETIAEISRKAIANAYGLEAVNPGFLYENTPGLARAHERLVQVLDTIAALDGLQPENSRQAPAASSPATEAAPAGTPDPAAVAPLDSTAPGSSCGILIDESDFRVTFDGIQVRFTGRDRARLFALLARITRRPGVRVSFDDLCEQGDVWDGWRAEDPTIRSALSRLRNRLREGGLGVVASAIESFTYANRQYVMISPDKLVNKSN